MGNLLMELDMIKYFDYETLRAANEKAKDLNYNRTLEHSFFKEIDKDALFPITWSMPHNDENIRVRFVHNEFGAESSAAFLDITLDDFHALPATEVNV
tara:strand:+ start:302 stop:595 length:294 start_codon:yes stop_codon:yes gene_type:complete